MIACTSALRRLWPLLLTAAVSGCECGPGVSIPTPDDYDAGMDAGDDAGDAGKHFPCGVDCAGFKAPPCMISVCNTGQVPGPLHTCTFVPAPDGNLCDDGKFCTVGDFCDKGTCVGGPPNDCGLGSDSCSSVICYEDSQSCTATPADDGTACTPKDKCTVNGVCTVGNCIGAPKDCSGSPLTECNTVTCDPTSGLCVGTPDPGQDGQPCMFSGDLCTVNKACLNGQCTGGTPKSCSTDDVGCVIGTCDPTSGACAPGYAPAGASCTNGLGACQSGTCDGKGSCMGSTAADGSSCNDHDPCTQGDACSSGVCGGTPVAGCQRYLSEGFETCPDGWTLAGDWQCGAPTGASPVIPYDGSNVLATQLDGLYHNSQSFSSCIADSPAIDLSKAATPTLFFWAWTSTQPNDGWNVEVSGDGGSTFQVVTPTPAYNTPMLATTGEPAFSGDLSAQSWQPYSADLSAYTGGSLILRFAFSSDIQAEGPGVYIDDVVVAEPAVIPLHISTTSLGDAYVGKDYSATIAKLGGSSGSTWKLVSMKNAGWLNFNTATGALTGTPTTAAVGQVSITVQISEPTLPSNFDQQTYTFNVKPDIYYTSWEGGCPDGWTLTGDWQCGTPMSPGPTNAYDGKQCLGAGLTKASYSNNDTWAGTTATSPVIDLAGALSPILTYRMWVDTEGLGHDGANLQISVNGGPFSVVTSVTPTYEWTIANEQAWGGQEGTLGWQSVQVDLTAYIGKKVRLQFAFDSDAATTFSGVYIDDFLVE